MSKKRNKKNWIKFAMVIFLLLLILSFVSLCFYVYYSAPNFDKNLLYSKESSNIFDQENNLIATIGIEKRQLVKYDELPQVLIDAIIATEDSRYYMHKGFDLPRFLKASINYLAGHNIGGASTIQMQISKNTFTSKETKGIDGIIRKLTDIYMSVFKLNKEYTKEEILEMYVNFPYLGNGSYGVKQACHTYFGKEISNINLVEAAFIAGLFQAPSLYNPYYNESDANTRKNEVIDLMLRHGYISLEEAVISKKVNIKDIVLKENKQLNPYQGFIDTVVQEVIDRTGNNPYEVSMDIYTTMMKSKQDVINNFYNTYKFKDNKVQAAISVIDNKTGAIIAVGAGRNKTSEMSFNYATQIKRHPGSTAKPIFDYGPGIEYNNWSTATIFVDKPTKYSTGQNLNNIDNKYQGALSLEQCLIRSRNTCALQAFKKISNTKINTFVMNLGITPEYLSDNEYINEAHSIGAFTGVSPLMLSGAYAAFGNEGIYNEPHSYTKLVYKNEKRKKEELIEYKSYRAMKETTAYLISYMLSKATSYKTKMKNTDIATKTGTSSYDEKALKKLGLSNNVIQDSWTVTYSKDYSIAIWYGYDSLSKEFYNTTSHAMSERINIQSSIVKSIIESGSKFKKPNGILYTTRTITDGEGNEKTFKGLVAKK